MGTVSYQPEKERSADSYRSRLRGVSGGSPSVLPGGWLRCAVGSAFGCCGYVCYGSWFELVLVAFVVSVLSDCRRDL